MEADRVAWAQATIAKAVEAVEAGLDVKADRIIRHAVHEGLHLARSLCDSPDFSPAKAAKRGRG